MAQQNVTKTGHEPQTVDLVTLEVVERQRLSPHVMRVTVGGSEIDTFVPLGFDQWFRLFLPVAGGSLDRVPAKLNVLTYLKFLTVAKTERPVIRNYTARSCRQDPTYGGVIDIDIVLHADPHAGPSSESGGPAGRWATSCEVGDPVAIIDEGCGFAPRPDTRAVRLVGDESAMPAIAGILASLPDDVVGEAVIEVPEMADIQELAHPPGVKVVWLERSDPHDRAGRLALEHVQDQPAAAAPYLGFAAGESALAVGARRHWVAQGAPKQDVAFCGYWRHGKAAPG